MQELYSAWCRWIPIVQLYLFDWESMDSEDEMSVSCESSKRDVCCNGCVEAWTNVQSFDDLVSCNIRYIQGELPASPCHWGAIDEETLPVKEELLQLCRAANVLTMSSQPRALEPLQGSQRGWIEGVVRCSLADFAAKLSATDLECVAVDAAGNCWTSNNLTITEGSWSFSRDDKGKHWAGLSQDWLKPQPLVKMAQGAVRRYDNFLTGEACAFYKLSQDPGIVYFNVTEHTWPCQAYNGEGGEVFRALHATLVPSQQIAAEVRPENQPLLLASMSINL